VDPQTWETAADDVDQWDTALLPALQLDPFATDAVPVYRPTGKFRRPPVEQRDDSRRTSPPAAAGSDTDEYLPTWVLPVVEADVEAQTTMRLPVVAPAAKSYMELVKNLATSSGIYALASLSAPFISLVLAPFLTHHLTTTDYGTLAICNTLISLVAGISQLGLGSAFFRAFGYDFTSPSGRKSVIASINVILVLTSLVVLVVAGLWSQEVAAVLLGDPKKSGLISIVAVVILIQNLSVPGLAWMRAANRPGFYSALAVCNLVIGLGANIYLIGFAHMGIEGALIATGCGYASIALIMLPISIVHSQLRLRLDVAWSMLAFGTPQVVSVVSAWVLALSDRYLLTLFGSLDQVAKYSVAYSLGTVVSTLIISPFQMAWPTAMFAIAKRPDAPQVYKIVFRWFGLLLLLAVFGLGVACTALLSWLFPWSYRTAAPVIPVVGLSLAMYGVYNVFMIGANIRRKTWMAGVFSLSAAVLNVGVNLILIPRYGAFGAAASTLVAYIALAIIAYIGNQMIYPIPFEIGRFMLAAVTGIALFIVVNAAASHTGIIGGVGFGAVGFIIYTGWLVLLARGTVRVRRPAKKPSNKPAGNVSVGGRS
jgi:O-antigen/teichoic acid export membrane protein